MKNYSNIKYNLDINENNILIGWVYDTSDDNKIIELDIIINGLFVMTVKAHQPRPDLSIMGIKNIYHGFEVNLSELSDEPNFTAQMVVKENKDIVIADQQAYLKRTNQTTQSITKPISIKYSLDIDDNYELGGWIYDSSNENKVVEIDIIINYLVVATIKANRSRPDLNVLGLNNTNHGFYINLAQFTNEAIFTAQVVVKENRDIVISENKKYISKKSQIDALSILQTHLRTSDYAVESSLNYELVYGIIPKFIQCLRQENTYKNDFDGVLLPAKIERYKRQSMVNLEPYVISIVIPVYKGIKETRECIESVFKASSSIQYQVIVINDSSPEPSMVIMLEELKALYNFQLFNNADNLGFVKTVNRGMEISRSTDVILLNSDTLVGDGWLDAFYYEAYQAQNSKTVGTITPLSNNATICSFPKICEYNELPRGYDLNAIARLCQTNQEAAIDLPTAHGFCMFIKRATIMDIGLFDDAKWGKGYGEENDFSIRAQALGWRNVMTNKTFVQHLGSISFAESADGFKKTNSELLDTLYPDYATRVRDFCLADEPRSLRNELAQKILSDESKRFRSDTIKRTILFVSLSLGGGTLKAAQDLAILLSEKDQQNVIYLKSVNAQNWKVSSSISNVEATFNINKEYIELIEFLKDLGVWHIHYHHTMQFNKSVWKLAIDLDCNYDVSLHDYYFVCPRVNLLTDNKHFCGQPLDTNVCNTCINKNGVNEASLLTFDEFGNSIIGWREFYYEKLKNAKHVMAPSDSTKMRFLKYFELPNIITKYHPEPIIEVDTHKFVNPLKLKDTTESLVIGFIGIVAHHKGFRVLKNLAEYIAQHKLNIQITIYGYTQNDPYFSTYNFVKILGAYKPSELDSLIINHPCDIMFLSSICPETYSFTYSETMAHSLPIISFNIGAITERAIGYDNVEVIDLTLQPEQILNNIYQFLRRYHSLERKAMLKRMGTTYDSIIENYYEF